MPSIQVRPLKTLEEFRECERIQTAVWGNLGVGSEVLTVTQKYGGIVLGALAEDRVVGFIYAFLARRHGRLIHWSHMMAVEEGYRDRGLGLRMKLGHRRLALKQGIKSICWTYDPLQSRNATLNLTRLRARVEEYIPDCYGRFPSLIEQGLPSDRFVVNWELRSSLPRRRREAAPRLPARASLPCVNETWLNDRLFLENSAVDLTLLGPRLLVEIPANSDAMRAEDLELARRWRMESRQIFQHYLAAGYGLEDFLPPSPASGGRCFYILERRRGRSRRSPVA
jgi:predicted GNAT superfamily acetyltransferase